MRLSVYMASQKNSYPIEKELNHHFSYAKKKFEEHTGATSIEINAKYKYCMW